MKKGGALQVTDTRKMPPPFHGPQQNSLETIYYHHGFPIVSNVCKCTVIFSKNTWCKIYIRGIGAGCAQYLTIFLTFQGEKLDKIRLRKRNVGHPIFNGFHDLHVGKNQGPRLELKPVGA